MTEVRITLIILTVAVCWMHCQCSPIVTRADESVDIVNDESDIDTKDGQGVVNLKTRAASLVEDDQDSVQSYLEQFGYLSGMRQRSAGAVISAITAFQKFNGLEETGVLDEPTRRLIQTPRCGVEDVHTGRQKRQTSLSKWPKKALTYAIHNGNEELGMAKTKEIMRKALNLWEDVTPLKFTEVTPTRSEDISIHFVRRDHTAEVGLSSYVEDPFDGPGKVLAHAFFPDLGDAHFDEDERFSDGKYGGVNLYQVAAHEFGHSLGLKHSSNKDALMAPYYRGYSPNLQLHSDDINRIQNLYGQKTESKPTPTPKPDAPKTTFRPAVGVTTLLIPHNPRTSFIPWTPSTFKPWVPTNGGHPGPGLTGSPAGPSYCADGQLDAIASWARSGEHFTIGFRGTTYLVLNNDRVVRSGALSNIWTIGYDSKTQVNSAIFALAPDGSTVLYIIKGSSIGVFKENNGNLQMSELKTVSSVFPDIPQNTLISASFTRPSTDNRIYLFSGTEYYRLQADRTNVYRVEQGYPRSITIWNLPSTLNSGISAAMLWGQNQRVYFYKGRHYYRYSRDFNSVDQGYPRDISTWWFGCSA